MVAIICNSGISFFDHYISTFFCFTKIKVDIFFLNKNLKIVSNKNHRIIITNESIKSFSLFDLINISRHITFYKHIKRLTKLNLFHFISVHPLNIIQILILKILNKKIISTVHDLTPHPDWKSKFIDIIQKLIIYLSDVIILHNIKDCKSLAKAVYIPLSGYELNLQKRDFHKTLLFFGRIEPYKGLANLKTLFEKFPTIRSNWKIIIAGNGKINIDFTNLSNVQIINRFISDEELIKLHKKSSICILPYDSATQSAVVLHSLSLGTPVLAYDVGSLGEYIFDWSGYIVKHNDFNTIESILNDFNKEHFDNFFTKIKQNYNQYYSKKAIEKKYFLVYEKF